MDEYLSDCLSSIIAQTYKNIEIICIDDGSTDDSGNILAEYARCDERVKVLRQENGGLASARSLGLAVARGEAILYIDSDDCVEKEMCENLMEIMRKEDVDVVGCSYKTFPNGHEHRFSMRMGGATSPEQLLKSTLFPQSSNDLCYVWRYLIKSNLLKKHKIDFNKDVRIGEDMIFMMEVFAKARMIYLTDYAPYLYRTNNQHSLMHEVRYRPYLEQSFSIMYNVKKRLIKENMWDCLTPFSRDLAEYTFKNYFPLFVRNRRSNGECPESYLKELLSLPMMQDAFSIIGFRNIYGSIKEYIVYLCLKFGVVSVIKRFY
ncbi:MAG: glycosyltransferase [Bacteroidaceae bacterium]|nr:glycosyltransferase [Bacteroidaceae bacterium]